MRKELCHDSNRMGRASNISEEAIFLREWKKMQRRIISHNSGYILLELILNNKPIETFPPGTPLACRLAEIDRPTQRDATVAASVIQWLGTKEGAIFLDRCERQIVVRKIRERKSHHRQANLGRHK